MCVCMCVCVCVCVCVYVCVCEYVCACTRAFAYIAPFLQAVPCHAVSSTVVKSARSTTFVRETASLT